MNTNGKIENSRNVGCPKGVEKRYFFSQETYLSRKFRCETVKSPLLKKLKCLPLASFRLKATDDLKTVFVDFTRNRINEYE